MFLYKKDAGNLFELKRIEFSLEKEIQVLIENNIDEIFGYQLVKSEFAIGKFRIDTLCYDHQNNSFVIVEYKRGKSYSVFDQGMHYLSLVRNHKADCVIEYQEQLNENLKRNDVNWDSLKIIIISPYFNEIQKGSVNFKDMDYLELWEINQFENGIVSLNEIRKDSSESIRDVASASKVVKEVTSEIKSYSEDSWIEKSNDEVKKLWRLLREKLEQYEMANFHTMKNYTQFKKDNLGVCYIKLRKNQLDIVMVRGNEQVNGDRSKNFFSIDDPKKLCGEQHYTWKSGVKRHEYILKVATTEEIDYADFLIKQKYNNI